MKNVFVLAIALLYLTGCASTKPKENANKIEQLVNELLTEKRTVAVAYSLRVGDIIKKDTAYGHASLTNKENLPKNAQFRIASMTKPLSATAIMQLVEKGKLSLTTTIDTFFPNLTNASKITIYHLLSHTSGIPNWFEAQMPSDEPKDFPMCKDPHTYIARMGVKSLFEPGTYHAYSNTGYVLLGEIIEKVSGQPYADYLKANIFVPANMPDTEMEYVERPSPDWVKGYAYNPEQGQPFVEPAYYHMPFSAGGLRSSSLDMINFMDALQNGKLVSKETYQKMTSYAVVNNGEPVYNHLFSPSGQAPNFPHNIKKWGYGLGFQIVENFGTTVISHGGDIAGFNSVMMFIPKSNTTLVILSNTENGIMSKLQDIEEAATSIEMAQ